MGSYYVYVYIDPRNHEEFYYGKGSGSRKDVHLNTQSDSAKSQRIAEIKAEGLSPMVRVIARGLTEAEALLAEKTLLWKLGKNMTNVATGHFADKFRPQNSFHKELPGFDYANGLYYYNVGEGPCRNWDDYRRYGFISAGQGKRWRDAMLNFVPGDLFAAYLKGNGFVGIGKIKTVAKMVREVLVDGKALLSLPLAQPGIGRNHGDSDRSEYVCLVKWVRTVGRDEAKWQGGLFTTQHVRASLESQPATTRFLETAFGFNAKELIT